jgi:hypothetical protein
MGNCFYLDRLNASQSLTVANLCIDGALLTAVASLAVDDNNNIEVNAQTSGACSTELSKVTAKKYLPNAER